MAAFESIPGEILLLIFQSIDSVAQLGQCRQVCKKWDDPAEFVMFCKPISITAYNAMPLYTHLSQKPSRAKLIKTLYFDFYRISSSIIQLLRLALTPSIEKTISRQEFNNNDPCFEIILDIVEGSQEGFPNVKSIPAASEFTDIYRKTLLLFKDSIETICIPTDEQNERHTFDELGEFKQLSKIILNGYFEDLPHVESILDKACHLKEIEIGTCEFDLLDNNWSTQETFDWMKQHVEINQNVTTIKLAENSDHNPSLMEYLAYKYPNTKHLDIEACEFFRVGNGNERICRAISKIPNYSMTDLKNFEYFFPYLKILKGDKNMFQLTYVGKSSKYLYEDGSTLEIRSNQDQQRITKSQIIIHTDLHSPLLYDSHVRFLKEIGGFATDLEMDFVKAYDEEDFAGEDWDRPLNIEAKIFFTALNQARGL